MHLDKERIVRLSAKLTEEEPLLEEEVRDLQHAKKCAGCEKRLIFCLDMLNFLEPKNLERHMRAQVHQSKNIMENVSGAVNAVLCKIHFTWNKMAEKINCAVKECVAEYLNFEEPFDFALVRGKGAEEIVTLTAEESLIEYDIEKQRVKIYLDKEAVKEKTLCAVLCSMEAKERKVFEDDGRGMLTAVFEHIKKEDFILKIEEING